MTRCEFTNCVGSLQFNRIAKSSAKQLVHVYIYFIHTFVSTNWPLLINALPLTKSVFRPRKGPKSYKKLNLVHCEYYDTNVQKRDHRADNWRRRHCGQPPKFRNSEIIHKWCHSPVAFWKLTLQPHYELCIC